MNIMDHSLGYPKNIIDSISDFLPEENAAGKSISDCREFAAIDLRKKVPFFSQFIFPNPQVACARACQFTMAMFFGDPQAGSIAHRIIVARSDSGLALKILPEARQGVQYIDQQIETGNPVMAGVNHTLHTTRNGNVVKKGQADGEDADHFVIIVGKGYDYSLEQVYYFYYQVGRSAANEESATSTNNRLYLNESDYSLVGESWNGKTYTVTDIRLN